jgi:hypothetical protein
VTEIQTDEADVRTELRRLRQEVERLRTAQYAEPEFPPSYTAR